MTSSSYTFTIGPGIKMIALMFWTLLCLFGGWSAHSKYGKSNELFVLKQDNAAIKEIREDKEKATKELNLTKEQINGKIKHDCADVTFGDVFGVHLDEND